MQLPAQLSAFAVDVAYQNHPPWERGPSHPQCLI